MKDYSKYFKGPSLKDARSRGRTEVQHLDDAFEIPADMVELAKDRHIISRLMDVKRMKEILKHYLVS